MLFTEETISNRLTLIAQDDFNWLKLFDKATSDFNYINA